MPRNRAAKTQEELVHKLQHLSSNTLSKLDQTLDEFGDDQNLQRLIQQEQQRRRDGGSYSRSGRRTDG